jgi:hypothetical protein
MNEEEKQGRVDGEIIRGCRFGIFLFSFYLSCDILDFAIRVFL